MKQVGAWLWGVGLGLLLLGCGGEREREGWSRATPEVVASEGEWNGWKALKAENGLVTLITVPAIGGRTMVYRLGQHDLLWVNPNELGKTYEPPRTEGERRWHNFGGYKTWPAPQEKWGGPPDPLGSFLDGGPYKGEILEAKGEKATLRVTSLAEEDATGLRFQRTLTLFHGTTRVRVEQTMVNISRQPVEWSLWAVAQVPGALQEGADFSPEARVYFPLNPQSRFEKGFFLFDEKTTSSPQWQPRPEEGLMMVEYRHERGKIGADSLAGWIAFADELHEVVFVQRFPVFPEASYPDKGATVEVYTHGQEPYMEVEVLSPLQRLKPGEAATFALEWYAARCPGPVRAVNEVGVVSQPLTARAQGENLRLEGIFGVFTEGWARFLFRDAEGKEIKRIGKLLVTPMAVFRLEEELKRPEGAVKVEVLLQDGDGKDLGVLAAAEIQEVPPPKVEPPSEPSPPPQGAAPPSERGGSS